jgi:hypothetical protein
MVGDFRTFVESHRHRVVVLSPYAPCSTLCWRTPRPVVMLNHTPRPRRWWRHVLGVDAPSLCPHQGWGGGVALPPRGASPWCQAITMGWAWRRGEAEVGTQAGAWHKGWRQQRVLNPPDPLSPLHLTTVPWLRSVWWRTRAIHREVEECRGMGREAVKKKEAWRWRMTMH